MLLSPARFSQFKGENCLPAVRKFSDHNGSKAYDAIGNRATLSVYCRALLINLPGLVLLITVCSLAGMVVYAEYHRCDPLATDRIHAKDQVTQSS